MGKVRTIKLVVDRFGSFLGMEKGCFILRDKKGNTKKYPLFETEIGSGSTEWQSSEHGSSKRSRVLADRRSGYYSKRLSDCDA